MVSLLDIGEVSEEITIRGKPVQVTGISAKGLVSLLDKFPEVRKLVANRADDVSAEDMLRLAPRAVAAAIAAGTGMPGDERAESIAASLSVGEQLDLLEVIFRLSFPSGVGPFVEKLTQLVGSAGDGASGWAQDMRSPEQLNSSSQPGTRQT